MLSSVSIPSQSGEQSNRLLRWHTRLDGNVLLAETFNDYERISAVRSERGLAKAPSDADTYDILVIGYPHETACLIANTVNESAVALQNYHPAISLQYLQTVVIAADYQDALTFCHESAHAFDGQFSQRVAHAWGCCFPTEQGTVVILRADVIAAALSTDAPQCVWGTHIIRHELCHAYDVGKRRTWLLRQAKAPNSYPRTYGYCQCLWAEYFANRLAHFADDGSDTDMRHLSHVLQHLHNLQRDQATSALCAAMGYVLGTLHAMAHPLQAVAPQLHHQIESMGLLHAWNMADTVLSEMIATWAVWDYEDGLLYATRAVHAVEQCCEQFCN